MESLRHFAATWWWTAAAAGLAGSYGWIAISNLLIPGLPYLDGTIQATLLALMLIGGIALQRRLPRVAGALAIAGALSGVTLWWSPVIQLIAAATCVGAVILALRHTKGALARVWTGVALVIVGLAPIAFVATGSRGQLNASHALVLFAAVAGIALLAAAGRRRQVVTA